MEIKTTGRTDLDDLFRLSGVLTEKLSHTPFLAFVEAGDHVDVQTFDSARRLAAAELPPATPVMVQWAGRYRSDFFRMTAGDVAKALGARLKSP